MADTVDIRMLDKRVTDRYLKRNELSDKELEKHLKALPDLESETVTIESKLESLDMDDDEDMDDEDEDEAEA
jgi:hypothetical protein